MDSQGFPPSSVGMRNIPLHPAPSPLTSDWIDGLLLKVLEEDPPSDLILPLDCPMVGPNRLSHEEIRGCADFPKHVRQPSCLEVHRECMEFTELYGDYSDQSDCFVHDRTLKYNTVLYVATHAILGCAIN